MPRGSEERPRAISIAGRRQARQPARAARARGPRALMRVSPLSAAAMPWCGATRRGRGFRCFGYDEGFRRRRLRAFLGDDGSARGGPDFADSQHPVLRRARCTRSGRSGGRSFERRSARGIRTRVERASRYSPERCKRGQEEDMIGDATCLTRLVHARARTGVLTNDRRQRPCLPLVITACPPS